MAAHDDDHLRLLMMQAEESPTGLVIATPNPTLLRNRLYALRRETPGAFTSLSFVCPPTDGELWIVNRESNDGTEED